MKKYLSSRQLRAIDILLDEGTVKLLRKKMNLRWSTILRWRAQPEFMARLNGCKHALSEDLDYMRENRMQTLSCETLYGLKDALFSDFPETDMIKSGIDVLKCVGKTPKILENIGSDQKPSKTVKNEKNPSKIIEISDGKNNLIA